MKIIIEHPQFEAFLEDGAKQNNQTKSVFFQKIFLGLLIEDYKRKKMSEEEILKKFAINESQRENIDKYKISDLNNEIMRKHFTDDFDFESLEFKLVSED